MLTNKSKKVRFFNVRKRSESETINEFLAYQFAFNSGRFAADLIGLLQQKDWLGLCNYSIEYYHNDNAFHLRNARQCLALYQKNVDYDLQIDREAVAWETFAAAEFQCKRTNEWFRSLQSSNSYIAGFEAEFFALRSKIAVILGDCPSLSELTLGFGPGSNTTVKKITSHRFKLNAKPVCSKEAVGALQALWQTIPGYAVSHAGICRRGYGQLSFVPKNAKTDRSIIVEPVVNTFVQKGIGQWIKKRLMMFGCNLKDQTKNQKLAMLGSLYDHLATIDLSSASDTLAANVVLELLPMDWVHLLSTWRTGCVEYRKKKLIIEQNKFSSMGNGFTFELESLIFYSIALAVAEVRKVSTREISVFGDDIIVPSEIYEPVSQLLELCGFSINKAKSFAAGSFRESCGADFFQGQNIRPFYVKDRWTSARIVGLLNFYHNDLTMLPHTTRLFLLSHLPTAHKLYGPPGYGDGHIHTDMHSCFYKKKHSGHVFKTHVKRTESLDDGVLAIGDSLIPTYSAYLASSGNDRPDPLGLNDRITLDYITGGNSSYRGKCHSPREWWKLSSFRTAKGSTVVSNIDSREFDPYAISGGYKEKKVNVFILNARGSSLRR